LPAKGRIGENTSGALKKTMEQKSVKAQQGDFNIDKVDFVKWENNPNDFQREPVSPQERKVQENLWLRSIDKRVLGVI